MPSERRNDTTRNPGPDEEYCSSCGDVVKQAAEICPNCGVRRTPASGSKNPGIAAVLSFFITGVGQIYNGQVGKGLVLMAIQVFNVFLMLILIGVLTYLLVWAYSIYDAYTVAEKINRGEMRS